MIWALILTAWTCAALVVALFVHAATRVSTPKVVECSWDYKPALIENCKFVWDAKAKSLHITPVTPGADLTVQSNIFDCGGEMTFWFGESSSITNCTIQLGDAP